ncbi:carbohydrate kinase family protein [Planctomyces sp. SH-PL62]|uniref:carbohydrate kinase family protein n=1 Tax=Planctomyces sp. SH-PL62 TaxID=1636152 RepID=UPI00078CDEE1|nr:carbohydrate kinase [Planctomyces sp. SH-PL62]AMV38119.1 5-dehydro-2-deoxygluconokinase [Planctomyces sp. SH-PL62]
MFKILAVGEVLWDLLPGGKQLGGAPANFAYHARAFGADARIVTRVGDDDLGREVLERFRALGLPTDTVEVDAEAPTGTVSVDVDAAGQPRYTIHEDVAWDRIEAGPTAMAHAAEADAVCFGSLAQRSAKSREAIARIVAATRPDALRILDVNLRPPFVDREVVERSLGMANVLKLNDEELGVLAGMFGLAGSPREIVEALAGRFGLRLVAVTRGTAGSLLFAEGRWSDRPGTPVEVVDTIGAGDAFTAAMTMGLLAGRPLDEINRRADAVAAFVCTRPGGTPALPESLRSGF